MPDSEFRELSPPLDEMVERCTAALAVDCRISACYLVGSLARGDADVNSDVDLLVLVEGGRVESVLTEAESITSLVAPVLASDCLPDSMCFSVLYEVLDRVVKVDYDFVDERECANLAAESRAIRHSLSQCRPIFDRRRDKTPLLSNIETCASREESRIGTWFYIQAWSAIRMIRRGELLEAFDIVNHMRDPHVTRLVCNHASIPFENYRRMEQRLPEDLAAWLYRTTSGPDRTGLLNSLSEMLSLWEHLVEERGEERAAPRRRVSTRVNQEIKHLLNATDSGRDV